MNHTSALQVWAESRSPGTITQASAPRTAGTPRTSLPHFHHPGRFYYQRGYILALRPLFFLQKPNCLTLGPLFSGIYAHH